MGLKSIIFVFSVQMYNLNMFKISRQAKIKINYITWTEPSCKDSDDLMKSGNDTRAT